MDRTGAEGGTVLGQPMLFECMGICVSSPAHECETRGYLVYVLTVKYLLILFKFSDSTYWIERPYCGFFFFWGGGFFKTFLEGSVDHVIYRDYVVNRRSFIYCNLATLHLKQRMTPCRRQDHSEGHIDQKVGEEKTEWPLSVYFSSLSFATVKFRFCHHSSRNTSCVINLCCSN